MLTLPSKAAIACACFPVGQSTVLTIFSRKLARLAIFTAPFMGTEDAPRAVCVWNAIVCAFKRALITLWTSPWSFAILAFTFPVDEFGVVVYVYTERQVMWTELALFPSPGCFALTFACFLVELVASSTEGCIANTLVASLTHPASWAVLTRAGLLVKERSRWAITGL